MQEPSDPALTVSWVTPLRTLVLERTGYALPDHRMVREAVPFVLAEAAQRGIDPASFVTALAANEGSKGWLDLVELVTIGETYFFRHPSQIEAIVERCRSLHEQRGRPVRIWSAGCSTGEEPYTLAMRLEEEGVPAEITASDLNPETLRRASEVRRYGDRSVGHLSEARRDRWLVRKARGLWHLETPPASVVGFVRHNLVRDVPLRSQGRPWDILVCRNVLMYFPRQVGRDVAAALVGTLATEGSLWLAPCDHVGAAELGLCWDHEGGERFLRRGGGTQPTDAPSRVAVSAPAFAAAPSAADDVPTTGMESIGFLLERGLVASAVQALDDHLVRHGQDGGAWVARAALHLHAHAFEDALGALRHAASCRPRPPGLAYLRGTALLKAGRHGPAVEAFLEAARDDPDDWASSYQVALLYRRTGRRLLEEMMLKRTVDLLDQESPGPPEFGPAAHLVNSVHKDPDTACRLARARLVEFEGTDAQRRDS